MNKIVFNGQEYSISELSDKFKIPKYVIRQRLKSGLPIEEVLSNVDLRAKAIVVNGKNFSSISDAARHFGISREIAASRLNNGFSTEIAFGLEPIPSKSNSIKHPGILCQTVRQSLKKGLMIEQASQTDKLRPPGRYTINSKNNYLTDKEMTLYFCRGVYEGNILYKIGVTQEVELKNRNLPFDNIEIIYINRLKYRDAVSIENEIKDSFISYHFQLPKFNKFLEGYTECAVLTEEQAQVIKEQIQNKVYPLQLSKSRRIAAN